jgi:Zn-dependent protease with chaperone function
VKDLTHDQVIATLAHEFGHFKLNHIVSVLLGFQPLTPNLVNLNILKLFVFKKNKIKA